MGRIPHLLALGGKHTHSHLLRTGTFRKHLQRLLPPVSALQGDLIITFDIVYPKALSEEQKATAPRSGENRLSSMGIDG